MININLLAIYFRNGLIQTASCDAGANLDEDSMPRHVSSWDDGETLSENHNKVMRTGTFSENDVLIRIKQYDIPLKSLFSAFHWKNLALTSLRSFALFYLPLLEPRERVEDEDDDFLVEDLEEHHVDLVEPFKKSVKQIIREVLEKQPFAS